MPQEDIIAKITSRNIPGCAEIRPPKVNVARSLCMLDVVIVPGIWGEKVHAPSIIPK